MDCCLELLLCLFVCICVYIVAPPSWKTPQIYSSELPIPSKWPRETKVGYGNQCMGCVNGVHLFSLSLSLHLPLLSLLSPLCTTAAGDAFHRAAELHMGMETKHEAATHFVDAGQVLKREDPKGRYGSDQGIHDEI